MNADDRVVELLEELVALTRFTARPALTSTLQEALSDKRHLEAYRASDGNRDQRTVAELAKVSQPTVSNLWARWRRLGLVRVVDGRVQRLVDPTDLGITSEGEVPQGR